MSTQQRAAIFQLSVGLLALVVYALLHWLVSPRAAPAAMALLAPIGATPLLFRGAVGDERERYLARRAAVLGFATSYLVMVALCMGLWFQRAGRGEAAIDANVLPLIVMAAFASLIIVRAAALLLLASRPMDLAE